MIQPGRTYETHRRITQVRVTWVSRRPANGLAAGQTGTVEGVITAGPNKGKTFQWTRIGFEMSFKEVK